jgi:hypothetical protein
VAATAVGPEKFWAIPLTRNEQMSGHFTAYNAAGQQVASGSLFN